MTQYIDKSALVAEIDNRIKKYILLQQKPEMSDLQEELQNNIDCLNSIKGYILNTLEVKEVDLEEEIECSLPKPAWGWNEDYFGKSDPAYSMEQMKEFAKHFYSLGLKAQKEE